MDAKTAKQVGVKVTGGKEIRDLKRIFLLEDEPILLKLMEAELRHHDLDVWSFSNPNELKENCTFKDLSEQVVITDEHMPGMNGLEFVTELKNELGDQKPICIIFTGDATALESKPGFDSTDLVVEKPIDPEEFMALLHGMLKAENP